MKIGYIVALSVLLIIMFLCIVYVSTKAEKYKYSLIRLLASAIIGAVFYIIFLSSSNHSLATFWDTLYFWMCDILSLFMLGFVQEYSETDFDKPIIKKIFMILIGIDGIALLINTKLGFMFFLEKKSIEIRTSSVSYYTEVFQAPHYLHLCLCYVMIAYTIWILIYKIRKSGNINRLRYIFILVPFIILIIVNAICYSQGLPIDVSVAMYGIMSCIICFCVYSVVPNSILSQAQMYVMDHIEQGIIFLDEQGQCLYVNKVFKKWREEAGKERFKNVVDFLQLLSILRRNEKKVSARWNEEVTVDGEKHIIHIQYHNQLDKKQNNQGAYFILEDKTEENRKREEEHYRANYDILTGLYNRASFFEKADERIKQFPDESKYLLVSNVKDFKLVNNIYGKSYGDELIKRQAELIKKSMRDDTFCGRIYGDKFAMLICRDKFDSDIFQESVRNLQQYTLEKQYRIFYHIGVYDITGLSEPAEKLYNRVNMVMSNYRDDYDRIFVECSSEEIGKIVAKRELITEFDEAIKSNQFAMYLQPQVNENKVAIGAEALIRWNHPQKGLLFPNDFIEVFENAGLIYRLDLYIWRLAGKKISEWNKQGINDIYISVNISTKDFYYLDIYEEMVKIVNDYQISPKLLKLEITESALILDEKNEFSTISRLRDYGFEVEIDDFGSGYSSFNLLKDIGVDVLKIDRIFLKETQDHVKSRMILNTIITLAKKMQIDIVTEGVEKQSQVEMLMDMGCSIFQGYYFDKPLEVENFENKYLTKA